MAGTFQITEPFGDARLAELKLLSSADRDGSLNVPPLKSGPWRDLIAALISNDLITKFSYEQACQYYVDRQHGSSPVMKSDSGITGESRLERYTVIARIDALEQLYLGAAGSFWLTHAGRVRLSELRQAVTSGREREPLGVLWDVRHWQQDLQVAVFDVSQGSPVSVAYMDMNGLKTLNDQRGHDAGDRGLRMYFQALAAVLVEAGQAYRLAGDEVLAVLPGCEWTLAEKRIAAACRQLMKDSAADPQIGSILSISAGIVSVRDPALNPMEIRATADRAQYRAKNESRKHSPRPSVIAIEGVNELIFIAPEQ